MSRQIYAKQNLSVNRFSGPGQVAMVQINIEDKYTQMSVQVFRDMLREMEDALAS